MTQIIPFTSSGNEFASVTVPVNVAPETIRILTIGENKGALVWQCYTDHTPTRCVSPMADNVILPEGKWTIVGRLSELPIKEKLVILHNLKVQNISISGFDLILKKN